ncbi:MAG: ATP-binding protein [Planctomycetota bacterium]
MNKFNKRIFLLTSGISSAAVAGSFLFVSDGLLHKEMSSDERLDVSFILLFTACAGIFMSIVAGYFAAWTWSADASKIVASAHEAAQGGNNVRIRSHRRDEIGELARIVDGLVERRSALLRESESQQNELRAILDHATDGIIVLNPAGRVVLMNGAARVIFDAPHDSTGRLFEEVNRNPKVQDFVNKVRELPGIQQIDVLFGGDQNTAIRLRGGRIPDLEGRDERILLVAIDISDIRRLERARIDFVANASHELKTPLSAILGFAETLLDDPDLDAETRHRFLETILRNTKRLEELVGDMLRLARFDSETAVLRLESINTEKLCQSVVDAERASAERKNINLKLFASDQALPITGDRELLYQCISNLVSNAIKFTPARGFVHIEIHAVEGGVRIDVIDNGAGIAQEHILRIFERFYRADPARAREAGGTGLGLAIAKHAVLLHGGQIDVESELGKGSRFRVYLPLVPPE